MKEQKDLKEFLKPLLWDTNVTPEEAEELFYQKKTTVRGMLPENVYSKILKNYRWYKIIENIPESYLPIILDEKIIKMVWPQSLRDNYYYAKRILFE